MPRSFSFNEFIKQRDRYALPILLTFKKNKYHKTVCGGTLSILSTLLFLVFLGSQLYKIMTFQFTQTTSEYLLNNSFGDQTTFNISLNQVPIASKIINLDRTIMTNDTNTYLSQVFVQEKYVNETLTEQVFFNSVPCSDL